MFQTIFVSTIFTDLIHLAKNLDLRSPASEQDKDGVLGPLLVDKYFSHEKYGVGDILIRPGAEKGRQHVRRDIMVRHAFTYNLPNPLPEANH